MKTLKNLIYLLLSSSSTLSSKRFVGTCAFFVLVVDLFAYEYLKTPQFFVFAFLSIVFACFGLSTYEKKGATDAKKDIADSIIDKQPDQQSADNAADVLKADKPD